MLVLGATGFIGGAVARRLLEDGVEVRVLVRDAAAKASWEERGATVYLGDLGDPRSIADAAESATHVVCAAGIVSCRAAPRALRWTHVAGAENLVNACKHAEVTRLVYLTCTDVTLTPEDRMHWDEARPPAGRAFGERARSLQLAEELVLSTSGPELEAVSLRAAWVWGPGDTSRLPGLLREAKDGGIRLVGDGRTYLATTYIDHLVDAVVAALDAEGVAGRPFHVVDPVFQHARDFFSALSESLELPSPQATAPWALAWPMARLRGRGAKGLTPDEMLQRGRSSLFDFSAACGNLDYDPQVGFDEGLRRLAAWVEEQGGLDAVAEREAAPPDDASVDAQVRAAGGD